MARKNRRKKENCLNCGGSLLKDQNFCPDCGQENHYKVVPLKQLFLDFLGDYFTFDSKFFRSIFPLVFKPGELTREFNAGHRVRFIHPLRLYVFISVIFFFAISIDGDRPRLIGGAPESSGEAILDTVTLDLGGENDIRMARNDLKKMIKEEGIESILDSAKAEGPYKRWMGSQVLRALTEDPSTVVDHLLNTSSAYIFVLMPAYALMLFLFFWKSQMLYIEHLIFSFHVHSFFFLFEVVWILADRLIYDFGMGYIPPIITTIYLTFAFSKVYEKPILKSLALVIVSGIVYVLVIIGLMIPVSLISLALF